ncbi:uncharacterized protein LOC106880713 isoform X1 [Octopus bimaculoides]|uniref:Ig-like domain-containing protein n=1 Tax=Octopus bimaculoides TaxID=37653 RepID=A0A0L8FWD2_OCTBM|nr:uncharacterized protein LOC106880713 isoform X1 [Octopus bimaculoides]|eukprot:XP_014786273.1 PREDICTED: uncharacterized protein LOC106880713 isoform X1 [Octopus bimaculoides]
MLLVMMLLMMASYTSAFVEIVDMIPSGTFDMGHTTTLIIKCQYAADNLIQFFLLRNHTEVIFQYDYNLKRKAFVERNKKRGFECSPLAQNKGVVTCTKFNLTCEDATYYTCKTNVNISKTRLLKVKSHMKKLEFLNPPAKVNQLAFFKCSAYVGAPFGATNFVWVHTTQNHKWININSVVVPPLGKCLAPAVSLKKILIREGDIGYSNITCVLFGESRTMLLTNITGGEQEQIADNADKLYDANTLTRILKFAATLLVICNLR